MAEICWTANPKGSIRLSLSSIRPSIRTKNPIPEAVLISCGVTCWFLGTVLVHVDRGHSREQLRFSGD
jgi:hypothetical protein